MTYCRHCGEPQDSVSLCGKCLIKVRDLCDRAEEALKDLEDEIAKTTVKAPTGSGGGGDKTVISFSALSAKDNLVLAVKALQSRAGADMTGKPGDLKAKAYGLQKPGKDTAGDPLHYLVNDLATDLRKAILIIDVRQEKELLGRCSCGELVKAWAGTEVMNCPSCGNPVSKDEASERLNTQVMDGLNGAWLKDADMVIALEQCEMPVSIKTIQSWVKRRHLVRDGQNRTYFNDAVHLAERTRR